MWLMLLRLQACVYFCVFKFCNYQTDRIFLMTLPSFFSSSDISHLVLAIHTRSMYWYCCVAVTKFCFVLTRAPMGYSAERAPLGGIFCPPCPTPELIGAARRARRRSKALNEKIPMHIKNFLKEVTCKVKVRSKVRNMCFRIIAHRDRAINSRAPKLSQNASLQQESSLEEYYA